MKQLLRIFVLSFFISISHSQIPTNGLIAYYPFNGNANDKSGNENNGTAKGPVLTSDRFGNQNSAYSFDGVDDIIDIDNDIDFQNEMTVVGWIKMGSNDNGEYNFIGKYENDIDNQRSFYFTVLNKTINDKFSLSGQIGDPTFSFESDLDWDINWHQFVFVFSSGTLNVYLDNNKIGTSNLGITDVPNTDQSTWFGNRGATNGGLPSPGENFFLGDLDDIRFYSRVLNENEIQELYHEGGWDSENGLIAYYPFNGNANDESGNENHGYTNSQDESPVLTTDRFGNDNSAYLFDGINDHIEVPNNDQMNFGTDGTFTVACWIYMENYPVADVPVVDKEGNEATGPQHGDSFGYRILVTHDGRPYFICTDYGSGDPVWSDSILPLNKWHFLLGRRTNTNVELFLNGEFVKSVPHTNQNVSTDVTLNFGANLSPSQLRWFDGKIDDIRLFDCALTDEKIIELYCEGGWCNETPVAQCKDIIKDAGLNCSVDVLPEEVDNGSYDPDGDEITLSLDPVGPYPLGENLVALIVTDSSLYDTCYCVIDVTGGSGSFSGTASVNGAGLSGVTVKLLEDIDPTIIVGNTLTDESGVYIFEDIALNNYQVMIVVPLGYSANHNFIPDTVMCGDTTIVDFLLNKKIVVNDARGKGYWKHQFDVHVNGNGKAEESTEDLQNYIDEVHARYTPHFPIFADCDQFEDWQKVLSVKGNDGMEAKAKSHLAALVLNIFSEKLAQYEVVTEDGYTAGDVMTYVSELLPEEDFDSSNDELAKDLAEQVNEQQTIAIGQVHPSGNVLYKGAGRNSPDSQSNFIPDKFAIYQNYPNPFNPNTKIRFSVPKTCNVKIDVLNILGQKVKTLINERVERGYHLAEFNSLNLSSGLYFYRIKAGSYISVKKMILMK